ncbi:MAG: CinA family protein [Clostridiales bacterium]|nr:CinA family protein [Clostridiales bacterium]
MDFYCVAQEIGESLTKQHKTVATAESITGGLIASTLVSIPNCSNWFLQGCVTYSNESKSDRLNVDNNTLIAYGAVLKQVAIEMAKGIRETAKSDIGISTTGYAGPAGGDVHNPVGTVFIGISTENKSTAYKVKLLGNRNQVRKQATILALLFLQKEIALL